jgi:uncharacterized protein YkwD
LIASDEISDFGTTTDLLDASMLSTEQDVDFASLLNGLRIDDGLTTVTYDDRLDEAAQKHAQDMLDNDYFSHTSLDGSTHADRIAAEGYVAAYSGENIAAGQQTNEDVLAAWLQSDDHRELIYDESLPDQTAEHFALGVAGEGNGTKWVLLLAREQ